MVCKPTVGAFPKSYINLITKLVSWNAKIRRANKKLSLQPQKSFSPQLFCINNPGIFGTDTQ